MTASFATASPVLSSTALREIAHDFLAMTEPETARIIATHTAIGMARVMMGRVRMQDNGDRIELSLMTQWGQRAGIWLRVDQIDGAGLRRAAQFLNRAARELPKVSISRAPFHTELRPRTYLPNTAWHDSTAAAFADARHAAVAELMDPMLDAGLTGSAFVGVFAQSMIYADKQGLTAAGQMTDSEIAVTGWTDDRSGSGWAGQSARDWQLLVPSAVAAHAIDLTTRSAHPMVFEPGRYTVILDRPAVAQIVNAMGRQFDAEDTLSGRTPLYNPRAHRSRLGERIMDARLTLASDPNDPEAGFLPFNVGGMPLIPMTWVDHGVHVNLGFGAEFAASMGYTQPNDASAALRFQAVDGAATHTVEEMIANCQRGIYVNRLTDIAPDDPDPTVGMLTGLTSGGCFLIRNGKLDKPIKNLRFRESPWLFLNRVDAIGTVERTAFGFAPWTHSDWPVDPVVVPPLMIREFNFTALAEAV